MLSNAYFLANFRFDTAENDPAKNLQELAQKNVRGLVRGFPRAVRVRRVAVLRVPGRDRRGRRRRRGPKILPKCSANFRSFSAVSAQIFASEYAFCSIFQILPDYLAEIFEIWQ